MQFVTFNSGKKKLTLEIYLQEVVFVGRSRNGIIICIVLAR